jgi:phosphoglycolate phosphatase
VRDLIVFDWNGTVLDDIDRANDSLNAVLGRRGIPHLGIEEFRGRFELPLARMFTGLGVPADELVAAEHEWNAEMAARPPRATPGVVPMLAALRQAGFGLGVLSAAATATVRGDAVALGLETRFDFLLGGQRDKSAALRSVVDDASGRVFYVGDTEYDMVSARAAGAVAIGFGSGYRPAAGLTASGAVAVIDAMTELPALPVLLLTTRTPPVTTRTRPVTTRTRPAPPPATRP